MIMCPLCNKEKSNYATGCVDCKCSFNYVNELPLLKSRSFSGHRPNLLNLKER